VKGRTQGRRQTFKWPCRAAAVFILLAFFRAACCHCLSLSKPWFAKGATSSGAHARPHGGSQQRRRPPGTRICNEQGRQQWVYGITLHKLRAGCDTAWQVRRSNYVSSNTNAGHFGRCDFAAQHFREYGSTAKCRQSQLAMVCRGIAPDGLHGMPSLVHLPASTVHRILRCRATKHATAERREWPVF